MERTLRKVADNLWVADVDSAVEKADKVHLIVDCLGGTTYNGTKAKILRARPTGSTGHAWTPADLDRITNIVLRVWPSHRVLVHCRRGVSRSPVAAAAILLASGRAKTIESALAMTAAPGQRPATQSVAGLKLWWAEKQQLSLLLG